MRKQKLVLVGNGMAGVRCIEEIVTLNPEAFEITIFGSESHVNYNRILLSTVLQGDTSLEDITINDRDWYEGKQIKLFTGETVVKIDTVKQVVITDKKQEISYDRLIIATGSVPFLLPIPGSDKKGVTTFRTIEDCQSIMETAKQYKKAAVIGGGLLGLEAARGLLNLGMEVSVVHIGQYLLDRQLDQTAAKMLQAELENQGMKFLFEKQTQEVIGSSRTEGLIFTDGSKLDVDLVVMAAGVRPNVQLAKESGIEINRAILVNDFLQTSIENIYAVGECVEHRGSVYGLVKPLYEQGKALAKHICGIEDQGYRGSVLSTQLKISGIELFSAGQVHEDPSSKSIKLYDEVNRIYKKVVFKDHKIIGVVLFGNTSDRTRLLDMMIKQQDVSDLEKAALLQSSPEAGSSMASMPLSEIVCNCNGVSKGAILEAVQKEGLTTVDQVKKCTKASGSCGGCKPLVTELLAYIKSDACNEIIKKKSMCSCTSLTEDEVVQEMQLLGLTSPQEVIEQLNWNSKNGCSTCRPALEYYLGMIYPEYESEQELQFEDERLNVIVQENGAYTLIPQMYGGITSAEQLRTIAKVAEKYSVKNIAVTSEQRIHLMDVKKDVLSEICADLNMPLSSTYGNRVQNVKTCIGEHVCQCNKQPSLKLAVTLERKLASLKTPYRVKIGVSACMHNGAGSTTKDIGIIGTGLGWEIYVGGSSGRMVRSGQLLAVVPTEAEAAEIIMGLIQYYRESANYLERTWQWLDRLGLIHVREALFDQELRQELLVRLDEELSVRKSILVNSDYQ
ncbi:nitrite reductase large subunit [Bacillus sp. AFS076308]|uniref:nitrite reductase large subunit NirB n=1 Tax=unclassified Bacillus (in: firmicutes) TaxID=185979 RepID=UPI000BF9C6C5|nr:MULTISPECIES: nitrite reductase large subunit NirB [unclassified Bacillus (in: firmicutes)]PFO07836.1 nitrite reductase large subunit [Bacillus sp. AFS076308]PGV49585.1 nitrite reductase large subunit [Bacillus sp. AFS037270]